MRSAGSLKNSRQEKFNEATTPTDTDHQNADMGRSRKRTGLKYSRHASDRDTLEAGTRQREKLKTPKQIRDAAALEIRGTMPAPEKLAITLCEQGFGMEWSKTPAELRRLLANSARIGLMKLSYAMADVPGLLQGAHAARKESHDGK